MNVTETVKALEQAFVRSDIEAVLGLYAEDALMVIEPSHHLARGKDEIKRVFENIFKSALKAHQAEMNVLDNGETALYFSEWHLAGANSDTIHKHHAISVFQREGNVWRLVIDNAFGPMLLMR